MMPIHAMPYEEIIYRGDYRIIQRSVASTNTTPKVIIADYQLINETGLELALQIQRHSFIITGTSDLKIREAIVRQGCQFMMKPIKPDSLNSRLIQF
jgi:FixJ family two-component response regulator